LVFLPIRREETSPDAACGLHAYRTVPDVCGRFVYQTHIVKTALPVSWRISETVS
jgi:hypothetical protein